MRRLALMLALLAMAAGAKAASLDVFSVLPVPSTISPGQFFTVTVQVNNTYGTTVANVSTTVQAVGTGGAFASLSVSPSPFMVSITGSGQAFFTWVFQGSGCGQVSFSASATGYHSGSTITSAVLSSGPANLACTPTMTPTITPTSSPTPVVTATPTPWIIYGTATPGPVLGDASIPGNIYHPDLGQPLQLKFDAPMEGNVSIDLYNRLGQRVRSITRSVLPGSYTELWDGRSDQGLLVSSGIYVAQFRGKGLFKAVKFAVVK